MAINPDLVSGGPFYNQPGITGLPPLGSGCEVSSPRLQLTPDVAGDQVHCEQVADVRDLGILLEGCQVGEWHALAQLFQALLGDLAVLHELRVALEDRLGEQLAARDLDPELAL